MQRFIFIFGISPSWGIKTKSPRQFSREEVLYFDAGYHMSAEIRYLMHPAHVFVSHDFRKMADAEIHAKPMASYRILHVGHIFVSDRLIIDE